MGSLGRPIWTGRRALLAAIAAASVVTLVAALLTIRLSEAVHEDGPVELFQMACWYVAACFAAAGTLWAAPRDRGTLLLLAALGSAAAARESDMHILLNPNVIGYWGVRYRLSWWLSGSTPVGPRLLWGSFIVLGIAYGVHLVRRVLPGMGKHHNWVVTPLLGIAALSAIGVICDDLLRFRVPHLPAQVVEETSESAAGLLYLFTVARFRLKHGGGAKEAPVAAQENAPPEKAPAEAEVARTAQA